MLGGHERLPWTPAPDPGTAQRIGMIAYAPTDYYNTANDDVAVLEQAAAALGQAPPPGQSPPLGPEATSSVGIATALTPAPSTKVRLSTAERDLLCSAGFALRLPAQANERGAAGEWLAEAGVSATIRYDFPGGGWLTLAQTKQSSPDDDASAEAAPAGASGRIRLSTVGLAAEKATAHIAWADASRAYEVRAAGLPENEVRAWIRTLRDAKTPDGCRASE
ncbi:hypothetical protein MO973_08875 [Paenibacillus sp. TRM 82003]|nr:hypothetical protein [Paenibacillus sp. TRM 82003]